MDKAAPILTSDAVVQADGQRYDVVLEQGPHNWSAFAPSLPGCIATGSSEDEVKRLMQEAIERHLSALRADKTERPWLYGNSSDDRAV